MGLIGADFSVGWSAKHLRKGEAVAQRKTVLHDKLIFEKKMSFIFGA